MRFHFKIALLMVALCCPAITAQPVNDACTGALPLVLGANPFDSTGATTGTSSAPQCATLAVNDVWFTYTAGSNETVVFDTLGSSFSTVLTAYETTSCPPGFTDQIACSATNNPRVFFQGMTGTTYLIRVSARNNSTPSAGPGVVNVQEVLVPSNDSCLTPMPLTTPATVTFDTTASTSSLTFSCPMGPDLWYSVVAPATGKIVIDKTILVHHAVYPLPAGTCPTQLSEEIYCSLQEHTSTKVTAGQSYLIRLAPNIWATAAAIGELTVDFVTIPGNDECATPQTFPLGSTLAIDTIGATTDPGFLITCNPPPFGDQMNHSDLWYSFVAPINGIAQVNLSQDPQATPLHVLYDVPGVGICPTINDEVRCVQPATSATPVTAGITYLLRVGQSIHTHFYQGDLTIDVIPTPVADDCVNPIPVVSGMAMAVDTSLASISPVGTYPSCNMDEDLWYSLVAPGDGFLAVDVDVPINSSHAVYHVPGGLGTCPTDADMLTCTQFFWESTTPVTAGQTYLVRVAENFAGTLLGSVTIEYLPIPLLDDCATPEVIPTPLAGVPASVPFDTASATLGPAIDSGSCPFPFMKDHWYEITAPITGTMHVDVDFPCCTGDAYHEIFLSMPGGGCPTIADSISCTANPYFSDTPVVVGQTYLIRLGHGSVGTSLSGDLIVTFSGPPANDDCTSAQVITVPGLTAWDTSGASDDTNGLTGATCSAGPLNDVWFRFFAPASGQMQFVFTAGGNGWSSFTIYQFSGAGCPTDMDAIACKTGGNSATFSVTALTSYLVRVGRVAVTSPNLTGVFSLDYLLASPSNLICDGSIADQVTASYTIPVGSSYDLGVNVFVNGVMVATIPQAQTSYTHLLTPGFTGVVAVGFQGVSSTLGSTAIKSCNAAFGAPANDLCAGALSVTLTTYSFDNFGTSTDSTAPPFLCGNGSSDLWFALTPPANGIYEASTCGMTSFDSVIEVYNGSAGCPTHASSAIACNDFNSGCPLNNARVQWVGVAGTTYYIRLGGGTAFNGSTGIGDITFSQFCPDVTGLICDFDCNLQEVILAWDGGTHLSYDVYSSAAGLIAAGLITPTLTFMPLGTGEVTYTIDGICPSGAVSSSSCIEVIVDPLNPPPATDLVLALEGPFGFTNSVAAVDQALVANGKTTWVLPLRDFGTLNCFAQIAAGVERVWVMAGTMPENYALTAADGDALAAFLATGGDVYFESADHWGFQPVPSDLDDRDGVASAIDGVANFTSMDGIDSGIPNGDFSVYAAVSYQQDTQQLDFTDQLTLATATPALMAGVIWRNHDDAFGTTEPDYITGVLASHSDGGIMISCSWEFGGFTGDRNALLADYLDALAGGPQSPQFRRGDCNNDGQKNIADAVRMLGFLFPPVAPPQPLDCDSACDGNDDGSLDIADAISILGVLFPSGPPISWKAPDSCGPDPTLDGLPCAAYGSCP